MAGFLAALPLKECSVTIRIVLDLFRFVPNRGSIVLSRGIIVRVTCRREKQCTTAELKGLVCNMLKGSCRNLYVPPRGVSINCASVRMGL